MNHAHGLRQSSDRLRRYMARRGANGFVHPSRAFRLCPRVITDPIGYAFERIAAALGCTDDGEGEAEILCGHDRVYLIVDGVGTVIIIPGEQKAFARLKARRMIAYLDRVNAAMDGCLFDWLGPGSAERCDELRVALSVDLPAN